MDGGVVHFVGSLLQLRGSCPGGTPLVDDAGNVLLFNGARGMACQLLNPWVCLI